MEQSFDSCASSSSSVSSVTSPISSTPYSDVTKSKKVPKANHIRRPMNAFMIWSRIERQKILDQNMQVLNAEISKHLGLRWKGLNDEERFPFVQKADELRSLHQKEFPDYKYKPQKKEPKQLTKRGKVSSKNTDVKKTIKKKNTKQIDAKQNKLGPAKPNTSTAKLSKPNHPLSSETSLNSFSFSLYNEKESGVHCGYPNCSLQESQFHTCKVPANEQAADKTALNLSYPIKTNPQSLRLLHGMLLKKNQFTSGPICEMAKTCSNAIMAFNYFSERKIDIDPKDLAEKINGLYQEYRELGRQSKELCDDSSIDFSQEDIPDVIEAM